jgi:hypothetical protein
MGVRSESSIRIIRRSGAAEASSAVAAAVSTVDTDSREYWLRKIGYPETREDGTPLLTFEEALEGYSAKGFRDYLNTHDEIITFEKIRKLITVLEQHRGGTTQYKYKTSTGGHYKSDSKAVLRFADGLEVHLSNRNEEASFKIRYMLDPKPLKKKIAKAKHEKKKTFPISQYFSYPYSGWWVNLRLVKLGGTKHGEEQLLQLLDALLRNEGKLDV